MPCARLRSSCTASWRSRPIWSSIVLACSGSVSAIWRASRTPTASATRCCCAPSCRSRSMRRRSVSVASTMRARERAQLVGLAAHRVERLLQRGVELHVVQREPDLAGELGEREVVGLVERQRAVRAAHDDQAEQLARVRDRRGAQHRLVEAGEDRGQPHLRPRRARHAGVRDDGLLLGRRAGSSPGRGRAPTPRARAVRRRASTPRRPRGSSSPSATPRAGAAARRAGARASGGCRTCAAPRRARGPRRRRGASRAR